jgi:hypothetical protein
MRLGVDLSILNQKGTPAFYSDIFANRPAFGYAGRVFISTDTGAIYEDTGSAWVLIADAGAGTTGTLQQVTTNGNTTTQGLVVTAGNVAIGTATAGAPLDIHGTGTNAQFNGTGTNNAYVFFQNAGTSKWRLGNFYNAGANSFDIHDIASATTRISVRNTGEVLITGYETISNTPTFSSAGNYASNPSLSLTIPASSTFNTGASYSGMAASLLNTWQGNNTINSGAVMAGFIGVNRQSFSAAGYTETLTQGSAGIRAICGMQVLQQTGGSFSGTISHGASLLVQGVYPTSGANITYTNYYGLLINQLDEYGGVTFTNRWGIYQGGASDKNYFAGITTFSSSLTVPTATINNQLLLDRTSLTAATPLRFTTSGSNNWFIGMSPLGTSTNDLSFYSYGTSSSIMTLVNSSGNLLINSTTDLGQTLQSKGLVNVYTNNSSLQSSTAIGASGANTTFAMGSQYGQGTNGDNVAGLVILSINEASTNVNQGNAVYIGSLINPRGTGGTITQISKVLGSGITSLTLTINTGANTLIVNVVTASGGNYRANLTFIGGGGTS